MKKLYIAIRSNTQFMIDCCLLMHKNAIKMSLQKKVFIVVYFVRLLGRTPFPPETFPPGTETSGT